jgi:hypothetical protein
MRATSVPLLFAFVIACAGQASETVQEAGTQPQPDEEVLDGDSTGGAAPSFMRVAEMYPGVNWSREGDIVAHLDADSLLDRAIAGHYADTVVVVIARGSLPARDHAVFRFPINAGQQDGVCAGQTTLEVEDLVRDPDDDFTIELGLQELARIMVSLPAQTRGLALTGADCDKIHIYWDPSADAFGWWRL